MKLPHRFLLLLTLAALLSPPPQASALPNNLLESANRRRENADRAAALEAQKRLAEAAARGQAETTRLAQESVQPNPLAERAATAVPPEPSLLEQARSIAGQTQLSNAIANMSAEGRSALAQPVPKAAIVEEDTPLSPAPVVLAQAAPAAAPPAQPATGNPATPPQATPPSPGSPKPQPLKPTPIQDSKIEANRTLIYSADSFFDANRGVGVFTGNVRVYKIVGGKTDLYVECDDLEVFMKKEDTPKASKTPPPSPVSDTAPASELIQSNVTTDSAKGQTKEAGPSGAEDNGIDKIRARGAMVIVEKYTETGDIQVGKCKDLSFDGVTQIVTLRIWPQVQRGAHLQIADEASTVMTISPEGHFKSSNGRTRTEILQGDEAKPKTKGLRRAPEQ
jgi:hypothetical protein